MRGDHRGIGAIDVGLDRYVVGLLVEMPYEAGARDRLAGLASSGTEGSEEGLVSWGKG